VREAAGEPRCVSRLLDGYRRFLRSISIPTATAWRFPSMWTILDHMQRTSLVKAKAHLSELVDAAEHRGQRILILRHGKPAAAIVPVKVAEQSVRYRLMTPTQAEALLDDIAASAPELDMSIGEALGRNRLDG
jgi:prevent-host-death family protein